MADFDYSNDFKVALDSLIDVQHLGREGDRFITRSTHHTVLNTFIGYILEFLALDAEQMKGSLDIMSLEPSDMTKPNPSERIAYYLVHNGNDALRQWNWEFSKRFVADAEANS